MERVQATDVTGYLGQHRAFESLKRNVEMVGMARSRANANATRTAVAKLAP